MSTGYFLRSTYTFDPSGNYSLVDQLCITTTNGTTCQPDDSPEAGVAAVNNDQLLLSPATASDLGVRTYTFAITPDEVTGYNTLLFFMPDFVDQWFWVPD
jgi:hypothetical protein